MTVINLDSRRKPATYCCPRHVLDELAERIRARLDASQSLLVPRSDLEAALTDLTATTERLLPRQGQEGRG